MALPWQESHEHVTGVFRSQPAVESLVRDLQHVGYGWGDLSFMMSDATRELEYTGRTRAGEGALSGAVAGGILGALFGTLVFVPAVGFYLAGPVYGFVTGGLAGTVGGGLLGALVGFGLPEAKARSYEEMLHEEGNVLVMAHVRPDDVHRVYHLFERHGAMQTLQTR